MTEKAIVTKEQAELISQLQDKWSNDGIIQTHVKYAWTTEKYEPLNDLTTEELAKALINGYEVEKSPEERLRDYYEYLKDGEESVVRYGGSGAQLRQGWQSVETTLDTLGIKIEGINA